MTTKPPKLVPVPATAAQPQKELPKDLADKVLAFRCLATVHNLLTQGQFPYQAFTIVNESVNFMRSLHADAVMKASEHPNARDVPELATFLDQLAAAEEKAKTAEAEEVPSAPQA